MGVFGAVARFLLPPSCPGCGRPGPDDLLCLDCKRTAPLRTGAAPRIVRGIEVVVAPCRYDGLVRDLIVRLKTTGDRHPVAALASFFDEALSDEATIGRPDSVVPAPASAWRRRRRGFDQAELLASAAARVLRVPALFGALRRRPWRPRQATLDREARAANAVGLFDPAVGVFGRSVLLIDDVLTTGATLAAAAEALRRGGARRVSALVVAAVDGTSDGG